MKKGRFNLKFSIILVTLPQVYDTLAGILPRLRSGHTAQWAFYRTDCLSCYFTHPNTQIIRTRSGVTSGGRGQGSKFLMKGAIKRACVCRFIFDLSIMVVVNLYFVLGHFCSFENLCMLGHSLK